MWYSDKNYLLPFYTVLDRDTNYWLSFPYVVGQEYKLVVVFFDTVRDRDTYYWSFLIRCWTAIQIIGCLFNTVLYSETNYWFPPFYDEVQGYKLLVALFIRCATVIQIICLKGFLYDIGQGYKLFVALFMWRGKRVQIFDCLSYTVWYSDTNHWLPFYTVW